MSDIPPRAASRLGLALLMAAMGIAVEARAQTPSQTPPLPPPRPALPAAAAFPAPAAASLPGGRAKYFPMVESEAKQRGLPPEVADAVMRIESGYDASVVGGVGERGLMQLLPSTAAMLGFKGTLDELAEPEVNIRLGIRYLAEAWRRADGDLCRALMKYRAGHGEERMSALSAEYCRRARSHLAALGSPLGAGAAPAVTLSPKISAGTAPPSGSGMAMRGRHRVVVDSERFWSAHRARIRAITSRLHARRGRLASG